MWDLALLQYNTGVMPHRASDVEYEANQPPATGEGPTCPNNAKSIHSRQRSVPSRGPVACHADSPPPGLPLTFLFQTCRDRLVDSKEKMQDIQDTNPAHSLCKTRDCNLHPSTLSHVCEPMCHAGFTGAEHQGASPCIAPGAATQRRSPSITCGAHNTMLDTVRPISGLNSGSNS